MNSQTQRRRLRWGASLLLLGFTAPTSAHTADASPGGSIEKPGWKLTFHDEFDGTQLDPAKWDDHYWHGRTHSNNELEYYAPDGYQVTGGRLRLIGARRQMAGHDYTSGMISSFGHFAQQYGYFEIRAKFPKGKGFWPAFWLLPANKQWPPEIDVLEILGHETSKVYFTNHWRDAAGKHLSHGQSYSGPDFSQDYHTFAIDWEPGEITWYLDGVERARSTAGVPAEPMYLIANLAVGGDWPGNPDASTPFPGFMDVDYIRVYQKAALKAQLSTLTTPCRCGVAAGRPVGVRVVSGGGVRGRPVAHGCIRLLAPRPVSSGCFAPWLPSTSS